MSQPAGRGRVDLATTSPQVLDVLPDATVVLGGDRIVRYANRAACRLLGRASEQIVGRPFAATMIDLERGRMELADGAGGAVQVELRLSDAAWDGQPARLASIRPVDREGGGDDRPGSGDDLQGAAALRLLGRVAELCRRATREDSAYLPVLEQVREATGADLVTLERADDHGRTLSLVAGLSADGALPRHRLPAGHSLGARVARSGRATGVRDLSRRGDAEGQVPWTAGMRAWFGVPVPGNDGVWGTLAVGHVTPPDDVTAPGPLLEAVAAVLGALVERFAAHAALAESNARFRRLAEHAPDVLFRHGTGPGAALEYVSPSCQVLTGFEADELVEGGWDLAQLTVAEDRGRVEELLRAPTPNAIQRVRWLRRDGSVVHVEIRCSPHVDEAGAVVAIEGMVRDAGEREAFEAELAERALHDPLTGLANRALFYDRAHQVAARRTRQGTRAAVLFVDLDAFKAVNDSVGHEAGDHLLREIGQRLRRSVRPADTVARLGGDEFAVLCEDLATDADAMVVARRVVDDVRRPVMFGDRLLHVGASVGVAMLGAGVGGDEVVRRADMAMYRAKTGGRDKAVLFDDNMAEELRRLLGHQRELRLSLVRGDFELRYRPQVDLSDHTLIGAAAVLRWHHPSGALLTPPEFLAAADDVELAGALASWALHDAAGHAKSWVDAQPAWSPLVSVDLSPRQFHHPDLVELVQAALDTHALEPQHLCLEVAEEVLAPRPDAAVARLARLRDLGVVLALNGFGTGNSSLRILRDLPIHRLKIDQSLVAGLGTDAIDTAIVRSIIDLGRDLWLTVVAEGVDTLAQHDTLRSFGCPQAQGGLFSPTLTVAEMTEVTHRGRVEPTR